MSTIDNRPICHFFSQKQRCRNGAQCSFRHESVHNPHRPICTFWQLGTCRKGDACTFSHDTPSISQRTLTEPLRAECTFYLRGRCTAGDLCQFAHTAATSLQNRRPTEPPGLLQRPCKFFLQGRCTATNCVFSHHTPGNSTTARDDAAVKTERQSSSLTHLVQGEDRGPKVVNFQSPSESDQSGSDVTWLGLAGSYVKLRLGDGGGIEEIMTAFDSTHIMLDSLPADITEADLRPLINSFGDVEDITVHGVRQFQEHASAIVEFSSCLSALNAAAALHGLLVHSAAGSTATCSASVQARAGERSAANLRSNTVRLTWYQPSRLAYAHYRTIKRAKQQAEALNGLPFLGRRVSASFQKPKWNQESSFSVILGNVPPDATNEQVARFSKADSASLGKMSYEIYTGLQAIRDALQRFGTLESMETQPNQPNSTKIKALARFATALDAEKAVDALHNQAQSFLGNGPLWIERVYSINYTVPRVQYEALKNDISSLQTVDYRENSAKIRVYATDSNEMNIDPVSIRVYCSDPKPLGKLKAVIERVLAGEKWVDSNGSGIWDDCFARVEGEELLAAANTTGNGFARRDIHRRCIRLYGSDEGRAFLRLYLKVGIDEVVSRRQTFAIDSPTMRRLVTGGLERLQDIFGAGQLTLNIVKRTLTVRSENIDKDLIQRLLDDPTSIPVFEPAEATIDCPVCFSEVTNPTKLLCGHVYCLACIDHYLSSAATGVEFPIKCLGEAGACGVPIPRQDLKRLLKVQDEEAMIRSSFSSYVHMRPTEFKYCPTPDCPELYRPTTEGTVLRCPSCLGKICPACHVEYHEGSSCAEYREVQAGLGGDESFRMWREKNFVQPCPNCGMLLDKTSGCNHVVCTVCRTHLCWKCMGVFAADEIYPHMNQAHGSMYN